MSVSRFITPLIIVLVILVSLTDFVFADRSEWRNVPGGFLLHESCIFSVPNGVVADDNTVDFSRCKYRRQQVRRPADQIYAMDVHLSPPGGIVTQMNASWKVPTLPNSADGQTVYFWPGFKNTGPTMGLPVLQPVLQYGQDGSFWELQSWFVWGEEGVAVTAPAIDVSPGDSLVSYMNYDAGSQTWTIFGADMQTGETSNLQITRAKSCACDFQWAMLVLETIMDEGVCADYPASNSLLFTGVQLNNGTTPQWTTRVQMHDCNQVISQVKADSVLLTWKAA